ncbi:MAG: hypothetical protein K8L99_15660 [Anaerolineae bacterium]|nr:hypothetical protein [Anaerolineae bacterium]
MRSNPRRLARRGFDRMGPAAAMNTRRLMRNLRYPPPDQRIFRFLISGPAITLPTNWILFSGIIILFSASAFSITKLMSIAVLISFVSVAVALLNGFFQGILMVLQISNLMAKIRESGLYDLLCVLPGGAIHANWSIGITCLRHAHILKQLDSQTVWIIRILFSMMVIFSVARPSSNLWDGPTLAFTQFLALSIAFYIDDGQSITLGCLTGLLSPTYTRSPGEVRLHALTSYISLQLFIYLSTFAFVFTVIPAVAALFQPARTLTSFCQAILGLLWLYLLREGIISAVWRVLFYRLEAVPADYQTVISVSTRNC